MSAADVMSFLSGQLLLTLILAVPLAFAVSVLLLWIYRRTVRRLMAQNAAARPAASVVLISQPAAPQNTKASATLRIEYADTGAAHTHSERLLWSHAAVRIVAGLAFASVMTAAYMVFSGFGFDWLAASFLVVTYAWPLALVLSITAALSWRGVAAILAAYALVLAAIIGATATLTTVTPPQMASVWFATNAQASALVLLFLARPIRAVGPIVAAFMILAVAGALAIVLAVGSDARALDAFAMLGTNLHLGPLGTSALLLSTGAALAGAVGWVALRGLGRMYRARWATDQSILTDAVWLMFTVHYGLGLAYLAPHAVLAALGALAAYKIVAWAGFRIARAGTRGDAAAPSLLLLRVFALGQRSERLFSAFGRLWRYHGAIRMIAGPDLATATVEPHQFLEFLAGRLRHNFIANATQLETHLRDSSPRRDFDGRFRTTSFFCHDDTWKMALETLASKSDAVLMDLRGFGPGNAGCVYEIEELCDGVALPKVLFLIDATTGRAHLEEVFARAWDKITPASPNWTRSQSTAHVLVLDRGDAAHVAQVVARLEAAALPKIAPIGG